MADNPTPIELQKYLSGVDYPADRDALLDAARANNADQNVLDTLSKLPEQTFNKPTDVSSALDTD